jgi:chromosome segregation protein
LQRETLELNRSESDLVDLQRQLLSLDLTRKGILQQQTLQKERLAQYHSDSARLEAQLSSIHARQLGLQEELVQRQKDVATLTSDLSACRLNMAQYTAALEAERLAVADHEDAIRNAQQLCSDLETQDVTWQDQWRELTDILVQELDQRLKEDGFAWHKLPGLTASMEMTLAQLRTAVSGRKDLLTTLLASPVDHPDSWRSLVSQVAGSLSDSLDLLSAFEADWATYRTAIPQFLGEFLAPEGIITQKRDLENQMALGRVGIKSQKDLIRQRQESKEETLALIETHRTTLENLKVNEVRMQTLMAAAHEGVDRVAVELSAQQVQLSQTRAEQDTTAAKVLSCQKDLAGLELQQGSLGEQEAASALRKVALEAELQSRSTALAGRQEELKAHFGQVNAAQAEIDALQLIIVRLDAETQALLEHFRDKHSVSLEEFSADLSAPQDMEGNWKEAVFQKREELRLLGQINLMAVEEFTEVNDRHEFLLGQVQDLKQAREDLRRVTAEIRKESTQLFSEAFELIRVHFNNTFRRLFGGGRAELKLTEPDTVLESGIEMLCQPPGKKLESINLLSGGEKSMTAVALLFATFMVKPSPFCILDEIDAALDEANVSRFVAMLTEFSHNSQFVVITHNKKTVTGSSTMIGVTMESPGVSKILSVRLAGENEASA